MESCGPSQLLRESDTIRFGPQITGNMCRDIVYIRLSLSHHVDVFLWDREICITKVVKLQRKFIMMSINQFSVLAPRTFCVSYLVVLFFDFNIIFSFEVSVWYQWRSWTKRNSSICVCTKKVEFSCHEHFIKFDIVDVNFCGILFFLQIVMVCHHQVSWPTSSPHAAHTLRLFLSASSFQTDVVLMCLPR